MFVVVVVDKIKGIKILQQTVEDRTMNQREVIFDYIMQHGIDRYALSTMLRIRREELLRRAPFFECVEISGLCELLSYLCDCTVLARRVERRTAVTDKHMLCALVFNIVNRLAPPIRICTVCHKNCLAVMLRGDFEYTANRFERALLHKLHASASFLREGHTGTLVLKLNRTSARPSACISAEELLLNPLSDAYVFLHNF